MIYKKKTKYVFQKLMIFNAIWDISILILMIVGFSLPLRCPSDTKEIVSRNLFRFGVPIMHISLTGIVTRFLHIIVVGLAPTTLTLSRFVSYTYQ